MRLRPLDRTSLIVFIGLVGVCTAGSSSMAPQDTVLLRSSSVQIDQDGTQQSTNTTNPWLINERLKQYKRKLEEETKQRKKERRRATLESVRNKLPRVPKGKLEAVDAETVEKLSQQHRHLNWFSGNGGSNAYSSGVYVDPSQYYDKWAQAYRMLGGFIDCDHDMSENSGDSGDGNDGGNTACSRWMMWAAVRSWSVCGFLDNWRCFV